MNRDRHQSHLGLLYALAAYLAWGFIALYFHLLAAVPPLGILCHRVLWSVGFLAILITAQGQWKNLLQSLRIPKALPMLLLSTILIASNWYLFIFAIAHQRVIEASLGYFVTPLISVLLGIIFLRERLRPAQGVAIALAAIAVCNLAARSTTFPWIALGLAISFSLYGFIRKTVPVGPLIGLTVETSLLAPFAAAAIAAGAAGSLASWPRGTFPLLSLAGIITAVPLLWFAAAARRMRLSTLGFIQYISPTCQFLLGIAYFHEPLNRDKLTSFILIWTALAIFSADAILAHRAPQPVVAMAE